MQLPRRNHNLLTMTLCLMAAIACGDAIAESENASPPIPLAREELLELPQLENEAASEQDAPVTLELMPEETASPASPPTVESATEAVITPPVVVTPPADEVPPVNPLAVAEQPSVTTPDMLGAIQVSDTPFGPEYPPLVSPEATTREASPVNPPAVAEQPSVTTPDMPEAIQVSDTPFGPEYPAAVSPESAETAEAKPVTLAAEDVGGETIPDYWEGGSLMFTREEIERYKQALLTPKEVLQEEIAEQQAAAPPPPPAVPDYGAFTVHSILYHGKNRWMVWLNKKRFLPEMESPLENVEIVKVSRNKVTLHWRPSAPITLPEEHQDKRLSITEEGALSITLSPNQTLLVDSLRILEGKALTQEVVRLLIATRTKREQAKAAAEAAAAAAAAQNAENPGSIAALQALPPDKDRGNMNALIDQYRNAGLAK